MADPKEAFDIKKWFSGFVDPTTWGKSVIYMIMIGFLLLAGFTVYKAFFAKTGGNTNKPAGSVVTVLPGAKTGAITATSTSTNIQKTDDGKNWEAGIFGGGIYYDDKPGAFGGLHVSRKF